MGERAVLDVDLQWERNNEDHHTDVFHEDRLIVRRGQPFVITLSRKFEGNLLQTLSKAKLTAQTGPHPSVSSGTQVSMDLNGEKQDSGWSASVSLSGKAVSLTICPAPNALIGKYILVLSESSNHKTALGKFVLLFNPWCPDDTVYMEEKEQRDEYLLSQDGLIFCGNCNNISAMAWNFGQFESGILKASLEILDQSLEHRNDPGKDCRQRNDPIYVTRVLSAMINANDDNGVLWGRWNGNYSGGVEPSKWTGSVKILRQWHDSKCKPVKFGQCWVFAAVGCTVARAFGIPCRVITNFESAHDSNGDLKIERVLTEDGPPMKDSVWNFHCWVESWMKRPDLKPGYDGWQVSDPTPQEQSEGVMRCGPVPVKAIKEGDLTCKYDAAFVYAEVNADVVTKYRTRNGILEDVLSKDQIGQNISTKSIGKDTREDVTHLYKYREGSKEERESYMNAQVCQEFDLSIEDPGDVLKGSDFVSYIRVANKSSVKKMIQLQVSSGGVLHNGLLDNSAPQSYTGEHFLSRGEVLKVPMEHLYMRYSALLGTSSQLLVSVLLTDESTMARMMEKRTITLQDPKLNIQIVGQPRVGKESCVKLSVKNPLPENLSDCWFGVEGANLTNGQMLTQRISYVGSGKEAKTRICFTPIQSGPCKLMVTFYSKKLGYVKAYTNLNVSM
ncbi:protein-glutamine gamma-glutamyltransferase 2-like [Pygocentrus nattereri]|uniref:Protein-glutamine gamma-glutamyltransferase 2 n=1 Tax=Pygocentrus nattereri TaxID=42514 RepID=A0A3B4D8J6_PYGNA|nr:protein-glutamine gamma-glutamyltransferase 2-like [Pygocentrus nattereri]